MTPAQARIKRAVREAVERCGGVDGAGATAHRSRSVAGDWMNRQSPAFPPAECVLALDEAVLLQGHRPPITSALVRELGGVFVPLPGIDGEELDGGAAATEALLMVVDRVGQLAGQVRISLSDNYLDREEARALRGLLGDMIISAARFDLMLADRERG